MLTIHNEQGHYGIKDQKISRNHLCQKLTMYLGQQ